MFYVRVGRSLGRGALLVHLFLACHGGARRVLGSRGVLRRFGGLGPGLLRTVIFDVSGPVRLSQ